MDYRMYTSPHKEIKKVNKRRIHEALHVLLEIPHFLSLPAMENTTILKKTVISSKRRYKLSMINMDL